MPKRTYILVLLIVCAGIPFQSYAFFGELINQIDNTAKKMDGHLQRANQAREKTRNDMVGYCGKSWLTGMLARDIWKRKTETLVANSKTRPYRNTMDFSNACKAHDICYGTLGKSREKCDAGFIANMQNECGKINKQFYPSLKNSCFKMSAVYYNLVEEKGDESYRRAQEFVNKKPQLPSDR